MSLPGKIKKKKKNHPFRLCQVGKLEHSDYIAEGNRSGLKMRSSEQAAGKLGK